jgi:hypothetical protein
MSTCDNCNAVYKERNLCVALIADMALELGLTVGIKNHQGEEWEDDWRNVLFIELPTGQVSWHIHTSEMVNFLQIPKYEGIWDNHTTEEKYKRIVEMLQK